MKTITIKEVGPRDGLQNEKEILSTEQKINWIDMLSDTGLTYIEVSSFVPKNRIPQLSDAVEVCKGIKRKEGVTYAALVPNLRGLESALEADVDEVSVFMSASEAHNHKNINKSIAETLPILEEVIKEASCSGKTVRGYISTVFGCPYEGAVDSDAVWRISERLLSAGVRELSLGDTIGVANPTQVGDVIEETIKRFGKDRLALHFHDTRGMALANVLKSLELGITIFDSSLGGLGGCPYAPGATGNVATDDLVYMLEAMGYRTDIDTDRLQEAAVFIQDKLSKPLKSHQMNIYNSLERREINR
ncbi:MAG: hydroxymethylglutaryl-CoA lyase [Bacillus sp. (in: firmicutes)]